MCVCVKKKAQGRHVGGSPARVQARPHQKGHKRAARQLFIIIIIIIIIVVVVIIIQRSPISMVPRFGASMVAWSQKPMLALRPRPPTTASLAELKTPVPTLPVDAYVAYEGSVVARPLETL